MLSVWVAAQVTPRAPRPPASLATLGTWLQSRVTGARDSLSLVLVATSLITADFELDDGSFGTYRAAQ